MQLSGITYQKLCVQIVADMYRIIEIFPFRRLSSSLQSSPANGSRNLGEPRTASNSAGESRQTSANAREEESRVLSGGHEDLVATGHRLEARPRKKPR